MEIVRGQRSVCSQSHPHIRAFGSHVACRPLYAHETLFIPSFVSLPLGTNEHVDSVWRVVHLLFTLLSFAVTQKFSLHNAVGSINGQTVWIVNTFFEHLWYISESAKTYFLNNPPNMLKG